MSESTPTPDGIFAPKGVEFQSISPKLAVVRLVGELIVIVALAIAIVSTAVSLSSYIYWAFVPLAALALWLLWLIPRQVKAIGWALTDDDLYVRRGIMFKKMSVVPLGRLQYVDLRQGPLERMMGIAEVKLFTASAGTDASIVGVPKEHAAWLREEISRRGQSQLEGL